MMIEKQLKQDEVKNVNVKDVKGSVTGSEEKSILLSEATVDQLYAELERRGWELC